MKPPTIQLFKSRKPGVPISKIKKAPLGKTVPPTFIESKKDDGSFKKKRERLPKTADSNQNNSNIQFSRVP
jgi:hypothetical protein